MALLCCSSKPRNLLPGEAVAEVVLDRAGPLGLCVSGGQVLSASLYMGPPTPGNTSWGSSLWGFLHQFSNF